MTSAIIRFTSESAITGTNEPAFRLLAHNTGHPEDMMLLFERVGSHPAVVEAALFAAGNAFESDEITAALVAAVIRDFEPSDVSVIPAVERPEETEILGADYQFTVEVTGPSVTVRWECINPTLKANAAEGGCSEGEPVVGSFQQALR
jgi:hypothetical protein